MGKRLSRVSAVCLAAGLLLGSGTAAYAEDAASGDAQAVEDVTGTLGFAECDEAYYVNVRSEPSTESGEVIGILKNHDSAVIESVEDDGWYKVKSGDVEGYVAARLIRTGDEAAAIASEVAYNYAVSSAVSLNVRSEADEGSEVVASMNEGGEAEIVADEGNWFKVCLDADTYGYVSKDYVEERTDYPTGETIEQMMNDAEAEQEAEASVSEEDSGDGAQAETADDQPSGTAQADGSSGQGADSGQSDGDVSGSSATGAQTAETSDGSAQVPEQTAENLETAAEPETQAPQPETAAPETEAQAASAGTSDSSTGSAIAAYAGQFVGNPYVWGGTSLTGGADCSGFTMAVFAHFGVSLPHDAASQLYCGTQVTKDALQPGDLVFFSSSGSGIDHVAIYVGGGSIVHAANKNSGICYGSLNWMNPVAYCRVV